MISRMAMSLASCTVAVLVLSLACVTPGFAAESSLRGSVDGAVPLAEAAQPIGAEEPATLESVGEPIPDGTADSPLLENTSGRACVIDQAELLDAEEKARLDEACRKIYDTYGVLVAVVTVNDFGGGDIMDWQIRVFKEDPFEMRAQDGVMLAVSTSERDWGIQTFGGAQRAFNTYGRERIGGIVVESLSDEDYYGAFDDFVKLSERFLKEAEKGKPYSSEHPYRKSVPIWIIVAISFVASLVVSLGIVSSWKKSMNTQVRRSGAEEYLKLGSFHLTRSSDVFLYHTVSRTPKPKSNSGSGNGNGGSSMHSTSSGTSGKF